MKITAFIFFVAALFAGVSCSSLPQARQTDSVFDGVSRSSLPQARETDSGQRFPLPGYSRERNAEAKHIQAGLPFEVSIPIYFNDSLELGELDHMKKNFLRPLAASKYAKEIKLVIIEAPSGEWSTWRCWIELSDELGPISLTHYAGFYDGSSNRDSDGYSASRAYVLRELNRLGGIFGWK